MSYFTGGGPMEPLHPLGYHYPAGARAPETEHGVIYECVNGHRYEVRLIRDFECNWTDVEPETCPECGECRTKRSKDQTPPRDCEPYRGVCLNCQRDLPDCSCAHKP